MRNERAGLRLCAVLIGLALLWAAAALAAAAETDPTQLIGFADAQGDGLRTTTGGEGGEVVTVRTFAELEAAVEGDEPRVVQVQGPISGTEMVRPGSNKTIIGLGSDAAIQGFGFTLRAVQNVVIRNLRFQGGEDDAINMEEGTHHVWVDHNDFTDYADGLVDIKRGSSFITVSWNHVFAHQKTFLLGHSDENAAQDVGRLKVTYHHNWFDRTGSRHPRVRFGQAHVFNNLYDAVTTYGVASTEEADVVVQSNLFRNVVSPTFVGFEDSGPGDLLDIDNRLEQSGVPQTRGDAFDPSSFYAFSPDDPDDLAEMIPRLAGAGVLPALLPR
jgi:pectate lyase